MAIIKNRMQDIFRSLAFYFCDYSSRIFFIPFAGNFVNGDFYIIGFLLINIRCVDLNGKWTAYLDQTEECLSSNRTVNIAISAISLVFLITIASMYKLCIYSQKISPNNTFAQLNGFFNFYFHLGRTVLMIFFIAVPNVIL